MTCTCSWPRRIRVPQTTPPAGRAIEALHGHAIASGAVACQQELVREFVVNLTRYLTAAGNTRSAIALADEAITHWDKDAGENGATGSGSRVLMRVAKAGALFVQGLVDGGVPAPRGRPWPRCARTLTGGQRTSSNWRA